MKFNIHAGHNEQVSGAIGYLQETKENRIIKNLVISKLKSLNHEVYDCSDEVGSTQTRNLTNIVHKCNKHKVDVDVSIHFNVSNGLGHGSEVYYYSNQGKEYAHKVVNALSKLGFTNRGAKKNTTLYVLRKTKSPAILIECCFIDNKEDVRLYDSDKVANAIVEGLIGQTATVQPSTPKPAPVGKTTGIYEVTASDLSVRTGPGTNYSRLKHSQLTKNAKAHDKDKDGCLDKGTRVTVKLWNGNWAQIPSGWVCGNYLKKI